MFVLLSQETCQAVYNWQYIHCLELWVKLLSATYPNDAMEPLIYPLTQTIIGTIKYVEFKHLKLSLISSVFYLIYRI